MWRSKGNYVMVYAINIYMLEKRKTQKQKQHPTTLKQQLCEVKF